MLNATPRRELHQQQQAQPQSSQSTLFEGDVDMSAITAKLNSIGVSRSQSTPAHQFRMSAPPNLPFAPLSVPPERESDAEPFGQAQRSVSASNVRNDRKSVGSFGAMVAAASSGNNSSSSSSADRVSPNAFVSPQPSPRTAPSGNSGRLSYVAGSVALQQQHSPRAHAAARQSPVRAPLPASGSPSVYQPIPNPNANSRPPIALHQGEITQVQEYGVISLAPESELDHYVDLRQQAQAAQVQAQQQQQQARSIQWQHQQH